MDEDYRELRDIILYLQGASYEDACEVYNAILCDGDPDRMTLALLGLHDRFFFLTTLLNRPDAYHPWLYDRCREVEKEPDGYLDLWAREHYKSTVITFAGSLQEHARCSEVYGLIPELCKPYYNIDLAIGIFSHTRPIAKGFLGQIKEELERNEVLPKLYPDIFWDNPKSQAPRWSLDSGLMLKRKGNPKDASYEAYGLVDGQPTSKHFNLMIYDDVVSLESVSSPEMIQKTTKAWELSRNLSAKSASMDEADDRPRRTWYIGTRYNYADTYHTIMERGAAKKRIYPATDDGTISGNPVFLSLNDWNDKVKESSLETIACQQLQNPLAGEQQEMKPGWLRYWEVRPEILNIAILVDPASSKKKGTSNTAMAVIGMDGRHNKYLLDGACHKMTLSDRWRYLKHFRRKWITQPGVQTVKVGYERYGHQTDIEHYQEMMELENESFEIVVLNWPRDETNAKDDRIRRLIPDLQNWRFFFPWRPDPKHPEVKDTAKMREYDARGKRHLIAKPIKQKNEQGKLYDVFEYMLLNEYLFFPATTMKDFLDAMSRVYDIDLAPPQIVHEKDIVPIYYGEA